MSAGGGLPGGEARGSYVGEDAGQRPGYLGEVERSGEHLAVVDLPAGAGTHEAPQLPLAGPGPLRGLLGEGAERAEFTLRLDQLLGRCYRERADQLVFQASRGFIEWRMARRHNAAR